VTTRTALLTLAVAADGCENDGEMPWETRVVLAKLRVKAHPKGSSLEFGNAE